MSPAVLPLSMRRRSSKLDKPDKLDMLDMKDRRMILIALTLIVALFVLLAIFTPADDPDRNPLPSSYLFGQHGARAAYTLLEQSGYTIERWQQPLSRLALHAGPETVLVIAEPFALPEQNQQARHAIAVILRKGGRVLVTGFIGGTLLPGNHVTVSRQAAFAACEAQPEGLDPLAAPGSIWIVPRFTWKDSDSEARTVYTCAGQPVVVEMPVTAGRAIWWASSTPLENGSIQRGKNLELFLNSIGPSANHHIYWDESLHGARVPSPWDFVSGPVWPLLLFGSIGFALLIVLSMSRRSGPVRPLPQVPRTTPIEFLDALGSLYRSTGAASTALQIAWERFRTQSVLLTGQRNAQLDARELAAAIELRFGKLINGLEADLIDVEDACTNEALHPTRALELVRTLRRHEETLRQATKSGAPSSARLYRA